MKPAAAGIKPKKKKKSLFPNTSNQEHRGKAFAYEDIENLADVIYGETFSIIQGNRTMSFI